MKQLLESQICQALDDHSIYCLGLTVADLPCVDCFPVLSDALHICTFLFQVHCTQEMHLELVYPLCVASTQYSALCLCTRFMLYVL